MRKTMIRGLAAALALIGAATADPVDLSVPMAPLDVNWG
jgi:hypothetical protein